MTNKKIISIPIYVEYSDELYDSESSSDSYYKYDPRRVRCTKEEFNEWLDRGDSKNRYVSHDPDPCKPFITNTPEYKEKMMLEKEERAKFTALMGTGSFLDRMRAWD